jgi:hypothetical protein
MSETISAYSYLETDEYTGAFVWEAPGALTRHETEELM